MATLGDRALLDVAQHAGVERIDVAHDVQDDDVAVGLGAVGGAVLLLVASENPDRTLEIVLEGAEVLTDQLLDL